MTNDSPHGSAEAPSAADVIVDVRDVEYQIASRVILRGLDLAFRRGRVTGIMGPSGTGKTTLLKLITAEVAPTRGRIVVCGEDLATLDLRQVFALRLRKSPGSLETRLPLLAQLLETKTRSGAT